MALHSDKNKNNKNVFFGSKGSTRNVGKRMSRMILGWLLTVRGYYYANKLNSLTKLTYRFRFNASSASSFIYSRDWPICLSFYQPTTIFVSTFTFNT